MKGNPLQLQIFYIHNPTDNTYHSLCYTSCGALAGVKKDLNGMLLLEVFKDTETKKSLKKGF